MKLPAKTKPLSRLKNTAKGPIHHIEIHPAKNSKGGRAFTTRTFRHPPKQKGPVAPGLGGYPMAPAPEETVHEDDDGDGPDAEPDQDEE